MTSSISSYSLSQGLSGQIGSENAPPKATPLGVSSGTKSSETATGTAAALGEAVTLTPDAQTSTDLLEAARDATGVDGQAVQSLKAEVTSGSYQVPAESLAASIIAALKETSS